MLGLGPHASFIVAAYAATLVTIAGLILITVGDDRKQRRRIAELERAGIRRRSAANPPGRKTARKRTTKNANPSKPSAKANAAGAAKRPRPGKTPS